MSDVADIDSAHMLDDLVQQFADPFAFYRELIQNAIDAGSLEVEVSFEWTPAEDGEGGRITVYIEDWGEGMNRDIIEGKLTRLFSSAKDDDFTKIGKFGIGFVSVFAIGPDAVCVDTGREGESWRVLFGSDRSWELFDLDFPLEGTQIRVFKTLGDEDAKDEFVHRSRRVIKQWCRHVEVPVRIDGEDVREAFELPDSIVSTYYEEEGTRIVAAVVPSSNAPFGFYNRGLLLQEGTGSRYPNIGFKIDSRYLEHTLTRDQVVRDEHFDKAMRLIEKVTEELRDEVFEGLKRLAPEGPSDELAEHFRAQRLIGSNAPHDAEILPIIGGGAISPRAVDRLAKRTPLMMASEPDLLTDELSRMEIPVLHGRFNGAMHRYLIACDMEPRPHGEVFSIVSEIDPDEIPGGPALAEEVERLVRARGGSPRWVGFGSVGPTGSIRAPIVIVESRREIIEHRRHTTSSVLALSEGSELVIDPTQPIVEAALRIAVDEPELAAYQLVKASTLETGLDPIDDTTFVEAAIAARKLRQRRS